MKNKIPNFLKFFALLFIAVSAQGFSQDHNMHMEKKETAKEDGSGKISFGGKTVRYDLYVKDTLVNFIC